MAHPTGTKGFLYKPRHRKICSRSFLIPSSAYSSEFSRFSELLFRLGCPGSGVKKKNGRERWSVNRPHNKFSQRGASSINNTAPQKKKEKIVSGTWPIKLYVIDHAETEFEVQITSSRQVFFLTSKMTKLNNVNLKS